eukprot:Seg9737.2 transcript_id=Seg9737.2/GoldUCD/mRNA.D3Y31 product="hypothetical protein" protein_id=Seg9737.2/GoldUCD/D3Y31
MLDEEKGSRTLKSIKTNHAKGRKFNCQNKPLFDFIEIDHVVIDTLHLFLRICDVLIENLILRMKTEDAIQKSIFSSGFDVTKYKQMKHYVDLLNSLGIPFSFATNKDSRKMEYRSLNGPEKLLLFDRIKVADVLPNYEDSGKLQKLWDDFIQLYVELRKSFDCDATIDAFKKSVEAWIKDFLYFYETHQVTSYMHAFRCHVPQLLNMYGNIAFFNQQGLEKYNHTASKDYFRSTNHRGIEALRQLMLKKNRINHLQIIGAERIKIAIAAETAMISVIR